MWGVYTESPVPRVTALIPVTAVTPTSDFTGIRFSRSKTGHVHSPWFTYNWRKYDPVSPYTPGSYFHWLKEQSMDAFASALGLQKEDTICSQRENPKTMELEWRIGTIQPHREHLPPGPMKLNAGAPAIDI